MTADADGWASHRRVVTKRLADLESGQKAMAVDVTAIKVTVGRLTLIAGAAAAGAGSIVTIALGLFLQHLAGG